MGGALQVADSFLAELKSFKDANVYVVCYLSEHLKKYELGNRDSRFIFYRIDFSPAGYKTRYSVTRRLNRIAKIHKTDLVFTLFGPSYWRPKSLHVMGFADGWVYNSDSIAFSKLGSVDRFRRRVLTLYKIHRLKKEANHFILETNDAKNKFMNCLNLTDNEVSVISNTYNQVFDKVISEKSDRFDPDYFNLLTVAGYYPNKNLEIIPEVVKHIPSSFKVRFYVTLPDTIFKKIFGAMPEVINLGVQEIIEVPKLLHSSDAMFLPTLLETFSASYPEAMKMSTPILTSDLSFARDICGDAAEYFNPLDASDIANKIVTLAQNKKRMKELIDLSKIRLDKFHSAHDRAKLYIELCEKLLGNN